MNLPFIPHYRAAGLSSDQRGIGALYMWDVCREYTIQSELANLNENDGGTLTEAEVPDDEGRITLNPALQTASDYQWMHLSVKLMTLLKLRGD